MNGRVLVIGGGVEGVQTALDLAEAGVEVTLVAASSALRDEFGEGMLAFRPRFLEAANHPRIQLLTGAQITDLDGEKGSFRVTVLRRPRYVREDACTSCGRCETACPVTLLSLSDGSLHKAIRRPGAEFKGVPSTCVVDKRGVPPCNAACPAGVNVQGYVALISKGRLREALELIREAVPFPHILGRVCTHPCETACTRGKIDQPIGIASLKRYAADMSPSQYILMPTEDVPPAQYGQVAIVGAGPAGLTCARDLFRMGHVATVFEALPVAGGMVAVGMPRFRLPREVREAEIANLLKLGIEIKTNTPLGKDLTLSGLRLQGYEAIFIASGAHKNQRLNIPGEDLDGVVDSISFLRAINLRQPVKIGYDVVVIGGGYTSIDSARSAIRLHCRRVRLFYRRTAQEMAATPAEILETQEEGVEIEYLVAPVRILGENGKVVGVECQRMRLGEPDETGRPRPVPIEGANFVVEADTVITAIGQLPDLSIFEYGDIRPAHNGRTLIVDPLTLQTSVPGIFAGGDVVSGPRSMVDAVADGRRAAVSIDRYLRGEDLRAGRTIARPIPVEVDIRKVKIPPGKRRRIPVLPIKQRVKNFEEVETGYTTFMALREAKRCLNCGGCSECMECVRTCELEAVNHRMSGEETVIEAQSLVLTPLAAEALASRFSGGISGPGVYAVAPSSEEGGLSERLLRASAVAGTVLADLTEDGFLPAETRSDALASQPMLPVQTTARSPGKPRIGIFVCDCGGGISDVIDAAKLVRQFFRRGDIAYAQEIGYACSDDGALEIRLMALRHELSHVIVAACACCGLDQICFSCSDRRMECKRKLLKTGEADGLSYEFVNIREHCAWVHAANPERAFLKAKALIRGALARVKRSGSREHKSLTIRQSAAVIGGGKAGGGAAVALSRRGIPVTLLLLSAGSGDAPSEDAERPPADGRRSGVQILREVRIEDISGSVGAFVIRGWERGKPFAVKAGALVADWSAPAMHELSEPLKRALGGAPEEASPPPEPDPLLTRVPGVFRCGLAGESVWKGTALDEGVAVAAKASAFLRRGEVNIPETVVTVDPLVCRGCGTCVQVCEFGAPALGERRPGVFVSVIDEGRCRGCGTCAARCPSGAITQNALSDEQLVASMETMLIL